MIRARSAETSRTRRLATVLTVLTVVLAGGVPAVAAAVDGPSAAATVVVDGDGGADYATIQAAVDAAAAGDTVQVRPGTYEEQVVIDEDVTLVAPAGATLDGSETRAGVGIDIVGGAAPTIEGLTVEDYLVGVGASETSGEWVVRDTTIRGNFLGVEADNATGTWTVSDSEIRGNIGGVTASGTTGAWRIEGTTVNGSIVTVTAGRSSGDWTIADSVLTQGFLGVSAQNSTGDWTVETTTVSKMQGMGISAADAEGDWTIRDSTIRNVTVLASGVTYEGEIDNGTAVLATGTEGRWEIHGTAFVDHSGHGVNAEGAAVEGDATGNWWGQASGPVAGDCVGNVDCGNPLSSGPVDGDDGDDGDGNNPFSGGVPGVGGQSPADTNGDGRYEDVDGDGQATFDDAIALAFADFGAINANAEGRAALDFTGDGTVGFQDAVALAFEV